MGKRTADHIGLSPGELNLSKHNRFIIVFFIKYPNIIFTEQYQIKKAA